jgi:hypothetical protein
MAYRNATPNHHAASAAIAAARSGRMRNSESKPIT